MTIPSVNNKIYGNCKVYHPNGTLMFLCTDKRINWYLSRNLASIILEDPLSIKLNFIPKGFGNSNDLYYVSEKENKCVVCGSFDNLTKHHVVPYCFRKFFQENVKNRDSHDILILCSSCHALYEKPAFNLKKRLALSNDCSVDQTNNSYLYKIIKAKNYVNILMSNNINIPDERKNKIRLILKSLVGDLSFDEILNLKVEKENNFFGKKVVENIVGLNSFIKLWRIHFIEIMKPQFLPLHWSVDHRL